MRLLHATENCNSIENDVDQNKTRSTKVSASVEDLSRQNSQISKTILQKSETLNEDISKQSQQRLIKLFLDYLKPKFGKNLSNFSNIALAVNDLLSRYYESSMLDLYFNSESNNFKVSAKIVGERFVMNCRQAMKTTNKVEMSFSTNFMIFTAYHLALISSLAQFPGALKKLIEGENRRIIAYCCFLLRDGNLPYIRFVSNHKEEYVAVKQKILQNFLISQFSGKFFRSAYEKYFALYCPYIGDQIYALSNKIF